MRATHLVDSTLNDTTSVLRFIEDNWNLGRIGDQSFDAIAGSILGFFDSEQRHERRLILDPESSEVYFLRRVDALAAPALELSEGAGVCGRSAATPAN